MLSKYGNLSSMGIPNMEKYRYQVRTCVGYAYGTHNLRSEPYLFLLSCFVAVSAAKTSEEWKNNQNYLAFILYFNFNSLSCF